MLPLHGRAGFAMNSSIRMVFARLGSRVHVVGASSGLALCVLAGCGGSAVRSAESACRNQPVVAVLGFEAARVGRNELPIAILCDPKSTRPAECATSVEATFFPNPPPASFSPIAGKVTYRPAARVLDSGSDRLQFDYVINVVLDRKGTWAMQLKIRVPWVSTETQTTLTFPVDDSAPSALPQQSKGSRE
jgi:hypothetical protein